MHGTQTVFLVLVCGAIESPEEVSIVESERSANLNCTASRQLFSSVLSRHASTLIASPRTAGATGEAHPAV